MAKKKKADPVEELVKLLLIIVIIGVYLLTRSIQITIVAAILTTICIVVVIFYRSYVKNKKLKLSGISEIDKMDGFQFEYYLSLVFKGLGYKSKVTKSRGDFGADLVLTKDSQKVVVQAKRYSKKVGIKAIQEINTSRNYYGAEHAWVVSNNYFTKPAQVLAEKNQVHLVDREELMKMILKINPNFKPNPNIIRHSVPPKSIKCPRCRSVMVLRQSKYGEFYGCSNYPKCTGRLQIGKAPKGR